MLGYNGNPHKSSRNANRYSNLRDHLTVFARIAEMQPYKPETSVLGTHLEEPPAPPHI